MKKLTLLVLSAAVSIMVSGQVYPPFLLEETQITPPSFPHHEVLVHGQTASSIDEYLSIHVQYPPESNIRYLAGTEVVQFQVSATGELTSFKVINSVSPEIDLEVIRVLETTSGNWTPGVLNGKPSALSQEVSMVFKPHTSYDLAGKARDYQDRGNKLMFLQDDPERALKYYNKAVKLLPYEESILCVRCLCRYELGDDEGAREDLERILALNPEMKERYVTASPADFFTYLKYDVEQDYLSKY